MKMNAREDVEAPIDFVYEQITDFQAFERRAMRRGAEVLRVDDLKADGPGMAWDITFMLRGKQREVQIELARLDPPNGLTMASRSPTMGGQMVVELVALSRNRTRLNLDIELVPKNLTARLLVQSLKLARKTITRRLRKRVSQYAQELEERQSRVS
ncbi:hypothetical protein SAMN05443432_101206 [Roseovarius litoreus]|uniref:Polyketide cyclase / dehydrase and lipid transport n=1 Tax=Roseovarius litoreus TaxID=1155722 RepID=A0A1M6ZW90_9RHOB|nr:SRPBCC family protein [Roseovarius litoreus]SHL34646.1 hypothetical protein SAMN05443432_101206 [Roseovarius litoreus]